MEIKKYFHTIIKRLWIIILLPLLAGAAAYWYNFYMAVPVYEAHATLYVIYTEPEDPILTVDYSSLLAGEYLVKDYQEIVKSRTITSLVIKDLGLKNMTPEQLAASISVTSKNETRLFELAVRDVDPKRAQNIANKVSDVFITKAVELMKLNTVSLIDPAVLPTKPVSPTPVRNTAIIAFAGLIAAVGIAFLIEYLDDTIKSSEDVEKYLGLSVLGTIPVLNKK